MPETLYLIDLYSLVFQVFHAIPEMTSPRGLPTNAVFGVTRDLLNLLAQHKPTYLACAADAPGPVERSTWYPEYKAGRSETPPELIPQFPVIREVIGAFGIPYLECPGWEADDIIATWTTRAVAQGIEVVIVSNDKDLRQLLGPGVRIYQVRKNAWWGPAELQADWGVSPEQVIDFQALVGDSVDNIPGVPLVGPKKAAALLAQWGTLERVLENAATAPGAKLRENLVTHAEQARMSQRLAALRRDLPIATDLAVARTGAWDVGALRDLFQKQGFRRFGDEMASLDRDWHGTTGKRPAATPKAPGASSGDPGLAEASSSAAPTRGAKGRVQQRLFATEEPAPAEPVPADLQPSTVPMATGPGLGSDSPGQGPAGDMAGPVGPAATDLFGESVAQPGEPASSGGPGEPGRPIRGPLRWEVVATRPQLDALIAQLNALDSFCLDLETTQLDPLQADIVGWALSWEAEVGWYIPVRGPAGATLLDPREVLEALRPVLARPELRLVNQNVKYDLLVLRRAGVRVAGLGLDPMIASHLLDAGARAHGLSELARRYLDREMIEISQLIGRGQAAQRMDEVAVERVAEYAAEDAAVAWELAGLLGERLRAEGLWDLYWNLERPLIEVLVDMQAQGIGLEVGQLAAQSQAVGERLRELMQSIHALAGGEFNLDSPKQLRKVLFEDLKLPVIKRTQTGPSTDQEVLEQLAGLHELPRLMLEHRMLQKLRGTYLEALPGLVNPETGRLHCSFSQVAAATGRLSASEPNLQNVPVRTQEGRLIRRAFVPSAAGWELLCADYSQVELRMLAHFSQDPALCAAFERGDDVHARVAAEVFGVELHEVNEHQRRLAKGVNFGVIYGQSPFGLAAQLHISRGEAAEFIEGYFARYPGVDAYLTRLLAECARTGWATTLLGRRRPIEGIRTGAAALAAGRQRNLAERTAINTVIQGSAADLIKRAMLSIHKRLQREANARLLLQIHDELVFEVRAEAIPEIAALVREEMLGALPLQVPLAVNISRGPNWLDQIDLD